MRLTAIIILSVSIHVSANTIAQRVTITGSNISLEKVFNEIRRQAGYEFLFNAYLLKDAKVATLDVKNADVKTVLDLSLSGQPFTYEIIDNTIAIKPRSGGQDLNRNKDNSSPVTSFFAPPVTGTVRDADGNALPGINVTIKGKQKGTVTDSEGNFKIDASSGDVLVFSSVEYNLYEYKVSKTLKIAIDLTRKVSSLQEVVVNKGYYTESKRFSAGSVSKITAEEIATQPVSNPLAALEGRATGLLVNQSSGSPGSSFTVQVRGRGSISSAYEPLFIIDGVPFAPQNNNINQFISAVTSPGANTIDNTNLAQTSNPDYGGPGLSPFSSINPADIEDIQILKDADATAIYGSRGADGVILITTKKGKAGKTKFSANLYRGASQVTRTMSLLNTQQYLMMRHEAYRNDSITPDNDPGSLSYAPDLFVFDTTRYTNFMKTFFGGTAHTNDINLSLTSGTVNTQFLLGAGYNDQSFIIPGDFRAKRGSVNSNIHHSSPDKKLLLDFSANYSFFQNNTSGEPSVYSAFTLPPDYPSFFDENGNLNWSYKGVVLDNPMAYLYKKYTSKQDNLISSLLAKYTLFKGLTISSNFGYNFMSVQEVSINPKKANNPAISTGSTAFFGINQYKNWVVEPQIQYDGKIGPGKLNVIAGSSLQQNNNSLSSQYGTDYANDLLLESISAAGSVTAFGNFTQYRYSAFYGTLNYIWKNRYSVRFSGRRDGSTRFGPGKQFGNFGSAGLAWIFSEESFCKNISFLSFGKLRGTYGTAGRDGIGDYQYLSAWSPDGTNGLPYQGTGTLIPQNIPNNQYAWELSKKFEIGMDLGFMHDRLNISATWNRSRSGNQLVYYALSGQSGFSSVVLNSPAVVQNTGLELEISSAVIKNSNFTWNSNLMITIPKNELLAYPGLETSSYYRRYFVGQSLAVLNLFTSKGVNPNTGIYEFQSKDGTPANPIYPDDLHPILNADPKVYGGFRNTFTYKSFQLDIFFDLRKQIRRNYLFETPMPGTSSNQPVAILSRWQKPGDHSSIEKFTSVNAGTPAADGKAYFASSDGLYTDGSFARLKTLAASWSFPQSFLNKIKMQQCRIYVNAQNLLTITNYKGNDPESVSYFSLPPLRTVTAGIQITL